MASRHVTGVYEFTVPYPVAPGWTAADIEFRCEFKVYLGRPARFYPWPGDPPEDAEVQSIGAIQVDAWGPMSRETFLHARAWLTPPPELLRLAEQYLAEHEDDIIAAAQEQIDYGPDADDLRDRLRDDRLTGDAA